jgi:hypothetical protein
MNNPLEKTQYKGWTIRLETDPEPANPREWDNLGHMACWHRRYTLGDEQPETSPEEFLKALAQQAVSQNYPEPLLEANLEKILEDHYAIAPLYLYDHSGISMSTKPFSCPWDSGQVGLIYCKLSDAQKEWGNLDKKRLKEKALQCLANEVEAYTQYLEGDVTGWIIENEQGEEIDSVWGYFPDDSQGYSNRWKTPLAEAQEAIDLCLSEQT